MKEREYIAKHGHETIGSHIVIVILRHELEMQGNDPEKIKDLLWSRYLAEIERGELLK